MGFIDKIKGMLSPSEKSAGSCCGSDSVCTEEKPDEPKPADSGCCGDGDHDHKEEDKASGGCGCS